MNSLNCRFCRHPLTHLVLDLGSMPLVSRFLSDQEKNQPEPKIPLRIFFCDNCFLVQLGETLAPEQLFTDYPYFSSLSSSWLEHSKKFAESAISRFQINPTKRVVEVASNDGYLLQFFKRKNIPVLGIEPARNVVEVSRKKDIPTQNEFFSTSLAEKLRAQGFSADLLVGNNVLAHVPDLHDFVAGLEILLKPKGVLSMEFPHLLKIMEGTQFDTMHHEHFSYLSLLAVEKIFSRYGLKIFDVEEIATHGGSLRVFAKLAGEESIPISPSVQALLKKERDFGLDQVKTFSNFSGKTRALRDELLEFLKQEKTQGKTIVGYGAPAKGVVLLNYCGIDTSFLDYVVDLSPAKQGRLIPGVHLPIFPPEKIKETHPDFLLILPWNLKGEIVPQMDFIRTWGGKFIVPIPHLEIL